MYVALIIEIRLIHVLIILKKRFDIYVLCMYNMFLGIGFRTIQIRLIIIRHNFFIKVIVLFLFLTPPRKKQFRIHLKTRIV